MIKVALVSAWHVHAEQYFNMTNANPLSEVAAVWDEDSERGKRMAEKNGSVFYSDYDELLNDKSIDAVIITSPTSMHTDLMIKAAKAGKHIFTEKVVAIENGDAEKIREAVKSAGIHFTICFPHESESPFLTVKRIVDGGELGKITYARFRKAHTGSIDNWLPGYFYDRSLCGGGAMIDLGAHPMYLLPWYMGKPVNVSSVFTDVTGRGVEDNAVSVIEFDDGAIGVSETGFVSWGNPLTLEISGTDGWLQMNDGDIRYRTRNSGGWKVPESAEKGTHPLNYFIENVALGRPDKLYTIEEAVELTKLMSAAYRSDTGKSVQKV